MLSGTSTSLRSRRRRDQLRGVSLDRGRVVNVLAEIVEFAPSTEWRLVGTASSALRGIDVPVGDVDVLLRDRSDIDVWTARLAEDTGITIDTAPAWLADACQYFARLVVDRATIEFSTVEIAAGTDASECVGDGPWTHFDDVDCGRFTVPAVATELRLITEVARGRVHIIRPLIEHLRVAGCDGPLVARGLSHAGISDAITAQVLVALTA